MTVPAGRHGRWANARPRSPERQPRTGLGRSCQARPMQTLTPSGDRLGRRVWALFLPYRRSLVVIVAAVLLGSGLGIITPFLTQIAFDQALFPIDGGAVDLPLLGWLVAGMIAIPVVTALIGVYQTYQTTLLGNQVMADLRGRLFEHLQRMDLSFFTATRTGAIQSRLANDVGGVQVGALRDRQLDPGQRGHGGRRTGRDGPAVLAADGGRGGAGAAVRAAADPGGPGPAADRRAHPGVALGHDGDHRGVAVGVRRAAGQGVQPAGLRGGPLPRGERAAGRSCRCVRR